MLSSAAVTVLAQVQIRQRSSESCIQKNKLCPGWIVDHFDRYTHPLTQHIVLVVTSVTIGFLIAFALALLAVFAGAGGLGTEIVSGSNITFKTGVVAAGGLALLLALALDVILLVVQRVLSPWRRMKPA